MDRTPLPFGDDSTEESDAPLAISTGEAASASFGESQTGTAIGLIQKNLLNSDFGQSVISKFDQSGEPDLTPKEANARYPGMPTKWNQPVNPLVAQLQNDQVQDSEKRQAAMSMGPQDPFSKATYFGAGLLAHFMDPLELGAGMVTGWGVGAVVSKTAWGAAAAQGIAEGTASIGTRTAFQAVEAGSGNLIQSTALEAGQAVTDNREGKEFDGLKAAQSIAVNTFFGSLFHMGIKEGSFQLGGLTPEMRLTRFLKNTDPNYDLTLARASVGAIADGFNPDIPKIMQAIVRQTDVNGNYTYEPFDKSEGKQFYIPANRDGTNLPLGDDLAAEGVIRATDNPSKAGVTGDVVKQVEMPGLNAIDTNAPPTEDMLPALKEATAGVAMDQDFLKGPVREQLLAIKEAIDEGAIPPDRLEKLQKDLGDLGYNAFKSDGTDVFGFDHSPHNDLHVFDPDIIQEKKQFDSSSVSPNNPTPDELKIASEVATDPKNATNVDPKQVDQFTKEMEAADHDGLGKENDFKYLDDAFQEQKENLQGLEKQGILDEQDQRDLDQLTHLEKLEEAGRTLLKAATDCVRKYG